MTATLTKCEAQRRDGSGCPHPGTVELDATRGYSPRRPEQQGECRTVHLCGQHKNALGRGIMAIPLHVPVGEAGTVYQDRDGNTFWDQYINRIIDMSDERESPLRRQWLPTRQGALILWRTHCWS
jgi:hypothetical protein